MRRLARLGALALAAGLPGPGVAAAHPVPTHDAASLARACEAGLERARGSMAGMRERPGGGEILREWNRLFIQIEEARAPADLLTDVHPDKAVRAAGEACQKAFTALATELNQDPKLFARVGAAPTANPREAKLKRDLLRDFEEGGVSLPPAKRARAKQIFDLLEEHRQAFERNAREDPSKLVLTPAQVAGMPEAYLKARKRDAEGNYVLGLDYPSYGPFMQNASDAGARERYFKMRLNQGGAPNLEHLHQLFILRRELAALHGLESFAHYQLRRKMAGTPAAVMRFLDEVKAAVTAVERRELAELRDAKARDLGVDPGQVRLERWDTAFYAERQRRERFDIDQEKLRAYFPADKALEFAFLVARRLYGLEFREAQVPVWHPDVRYFNVHDAKSGRYLSSFYVDLFPRAGKRAGAAAYPLASASRLEKRTPSAALVANFGREGFNHRELEVLMHEFGHVLNMVLADVDYAPQSIAMVKWDFVEAPSQMFEEWVRRAQPLALFREVCPECPQLSAAQIAGLDQARRLGQGIQFARQWLLASFDMALSTDPRPPLEVWKALESATPQGYVEGTMFPANFRHIAAGYAAGYYGYMWSQVIALDLLTPFEADMLDPAVGARYRKAILGAGVQAEEAAMVREFLGRDPTPEAFFAEITGRRR